MITSFRHRGLKRLFERDDKAQVRPDMLLKIENILAVLDRAHNPEDMNLPGFRLHQLKGDLRGHWAVTVRANWRITWRFDGSDAVDVDLIDTIRSIDHADEEPAASWPDCATGMP